MHTLSFSYRRILGFFLFSLGAFLFSMTAVAAKYEIDPLHSSVNFVAPHLGVSKVRGHFDKFSGTFTFDEKSQKLENVQVTIKTDSINTQVADRDKHLRSPDFFDAAKHPEITFKSTKVDYTMDKPTKVTGDLTIRGTKKPITLDVKYNGAVTDHFGARVIAFEATGKINRKDYGVSWHKALDSGGVVVGEEIQIEILGEAKVPTKK